MTETDGYGRLMHQALLRTRAFTPPLSPGAAGAGLASAYFFPSAWQGNQTVQWDTRSAATAQGAGLTVPCIPGRQYTATVYVWQSTSGGTQQITIDGTVTGTSVAIPLAWTRLQLTFTATQPSHSLTVQTTGQAVPGSVYIDAPQLEPGGSASAFTTTGPVVYGVSRGYVERWPAQWDHAGFRGRAELTCVDAFGPLNQIALWTEVRNSILAKDPDYYWPLAEPVGATSFAESSGNSGPTMVATQSTNGSGTDLVAGESSSIPGDPGGVSVRFTADIVHLNQLGECLTVGRGSNPGIVGIPATPGTAWAVTASIWVLASSVVYLGGGIPFICINPWPNNDAPFFLQVTPSGNVTANIQSITANPPSGSTLTATGSVIITDGTWHNLLVTASQDATNSTITLYIDGAVDATATIATAVYPFLGSTAHVVSIGAAMGAAFTSPFDGQISHTAVWTRLLSSSEIADLWSAGRGYPGELSGARVARQLAYGWTGPSSIDSGLSLMGTSALSGRPTTLSACQDVATSENGNFWVDARGNVTFTGRSVRYLAITPKYVFGEDVASGELPYQEGIGFDFDPTYIYNDVTVTQANGIIAHVTDTTVSQKKFFPRQFERTINVQSANETIDAANYILGQNKQPRVRVASIMLDPASYPTLWPVVLGLEIGTRVTVKRRAKGGSLIMSADFFVESIAHDGIDLEAGTWKTTLLLSPVSLYQVGILDDSTYGLLDSSMILAY